MNSSNTVELRLPTTKLMFIDVEGYTTDIRWNRELPIYCVCVLTIDERGVKQVRKFKNTQQAISFIERMLVEKYTIVAHNTKFDYAVLKLHGLNHTIEPNHLSVMCTQVMAYIKDSSLPSYSLSELTGEKTDVVQACLDLGLIERKLNATEFWSIDWTENTEVRKVIENYCVDDLKATVSLYKKLMLWYNANPKYIKPLLELEFPMLEVLSHMESSGVYIDGQLLNELRSSLNSEVNNYEQEIAKLFPLLPELTWSESNETYEPKEKTYAKSPYRNKANVSYYIDNEGIVTCSDAHIVGDHCKLVPYNPAAATGHTWWLLKNNYPEVLEAADKTKSGKPSLSKEFLLDIGDQLPDNLPLAKLSKANKYSQMAESLAKAVQLDGRIHCGFLNCRTRTTRLATVNPNQQNIPIPNDESGAIFRSLFAAPDSTKVILVADLDRIELCVLAWFLLKVEKDSYLADIINSGADVHQANADLWGVERFVAKTVIFLLVYGGSPALIFKRKLLPTMKEAEEAFNRVNETQPSIERLKQKVWKACRERGFVTNPFNAHGVYPECRSKQKWLRLRGERQSFNYLIQKTSRDILHFLLIESYPEIIKADAKLVNVVHDEAVIECSVEKSEELKLELNRIWNNRLDFLPGIKINGEWNIGRNWKEAK